MSSIQDKARELIKKGFEENQVGTMAILLERKDKIEKQIQEVENAKSDDDLHKIRNARSYE